MSARHEVTDALRQLGAGDEHALDRLAPLIYEDLRRLAHRQLAGRRQAQSAATTDLVHEAYLKLVARRDAPWRDRGHFFAVAARAMRHIFIDHVKKRRRQKRGGGAAHVTLDESRLLAEREADQVLALDEALKRLTTLDQRLARVVECRFFAGLTEEETAAALRVSSRTVQRDWARARSWLRREIED